MICFYVRVVFGETIGRTVGYFGKLEFKQISYIRLGEIKLVVIVGRSRLALLIFRQQLPGGLFSDMQWARAKVELTLSFRLSFCLGLITIIT